MAGLEVIDLVARARSGDHVAFERLAMEATPRLDAIARMILRDRDLACDAVQDALINAWLKLGTLRDPSKFDFWLNKLVTNSCLSLARRQPRFRVVDISDDLVGGAPDQTRELEDRQEISAAMQYLKPDHRAVLVLHFWLGLQPSEIAEMLAIPQGTARSRLSNALESMRGALAAERRR
jgi:RNA polymerase sigma-70 factor (ECF subfamily)